MVRYLPEINSKDLKTTFWGFCVKHNIKQWIPLIKLLPVDISAAAAYSHAGLTYGNGDPILSPTESIPVPPNSDYTNQNVVLTANSWCAAVLLSKKLPFLTFFGGLKVSGTNTTLALKGTYPVKTISSTGSFEYANLTDPISVNYDKTQFGINAGVRLKLGITSYFVDGVYAPGGFSSVNFGVGVGFFN
jgi:hypothetical protein